MRVRAPAIFLGTLLVAMILSGCIQGDDPDAPAGKEPEADEEANPEIQWPPIEEAQIRPGVQIRTEGHGWCTTNFVFTDNETNLYIGTAAHCVDDSIGAPVHLQKDPDFFTGEEGPEIGEVHYSARAHEDAYSEPCLVVLSCSAGSGNTTNDFALIKIHDDWRDQVHPAVLHFGGPTELVPLEEIQVDDKVLTQGNSPLRPGPTPADSREGFITEIDAPWLVTACILSPGVPGDSGSNALLGDGRALGIVITLGANTPCGTQNGITVLDTALDFAREHGADVKLATWDLINGGVLPDA